MTTDNFTEATRAEAERVARENTPLEYGSIWDAFVDAYAAGLRARTHLAAQEPTDAGPHELDESAPVRNLGYYRSSARCKCGHEVIWGEHDGDAGLDEAWRVHLMRSDVHVARAARRDEEKR